MTQTRRPIVSFETTSNHTPRGRTPGLAPAAVIVSNSPSTARNSTGCIFPGRTPRSTPSTTTNQPSACAKFSRSTTRTNATATDGVDRSADVCGTQSGRGGRGEVPAEVGEWVIGYLVDDDAPAGGLMETQRPVPIELISLDRSRLPICGGRRCHENLSRLVSPQGPGRPRLSQPAPRRAGPPRRRR